MSNQFSFVPSNSKEFRDTAPNGASVFYRSYSRRKDDGSRENFREAISRAVNDIADIGNFTNEQRRLVVDMGINQHCFPSGRALWVAGTEWSKKPENFPGYYNCCSMHVEHIGIFGLLMELAMMGTGTGAVLEKDVVAKLPPIVRYLRIANVIENEGKAGGSDKTEVNLTGYQGESPCISVVVGDSRAGWASGYQSLIELATGMPADGEDQVFEQEVLLTLDLSQIRQAGEPLRGFGGVANPVRLRSTLERVVGILNKAVGRQLKPIECCLLIDEASSAVVAGNIRRSAGMRQFSADDMEAAVSKEGLYKQDAEGGWSVDPEKEALRMANHTRCYHSKPSLAEIEDSVAKQYLSGEGAIQYVPEMLARSNADLLNTPELKQQFLRVYSTQGIEAGKVLLETLAIEAFEPHDPAIIEHRITRYGLNPCLTGDTKILTVHEGPKTFEELAKQGKDILVWCVNLETNEAAVRMMRRPRVTGYNQPTVEIEFDSGLKVRATHNHNFFTLQRNKVQAKDLKIGQSVSAFAIHQHRDGHLRVTRNNKYTDSVRQQFCHRVIGEYYGIEGEVIHHIDGDPTNNSPVNLAATNAYLHNREHYGDRCRNGFYHKTPGPAALEHIANHKVVSVRDSGTATVYNGTVDDHHNYVVVDSQAVGKSYTSGVLSANCGEINIRDNLCNLSEVHVNTISPADLETQFEAFYAGGLQVAALLNHEFVPAELNYSRKNDPIVGVSLTGGFDFFVHAFGAEWLDWMMKGRPTGKKFKKYTEKERAYLRVWRDAAEQGVTDYCEQIGIRKPNRFTTIQPAGSKSLLTGASPGWHPPKAQRFIRRITFGKNDPLAAALRDYGYNVIPAQSARDENGNLLNDINDSRVHEVLVEIPTEVSWANLPGCDAYDVSKLPIEGQWGLYMQFQNHYVTHNTSATLEFREAEIPKLAKLIYDNIQSDGGYISAALLARFDASETFPRLPFEPIDKKTYDGMMAQIKAYRSVLPADTTILDLLAPYDHSGHVLEPQDTACANESCLSKIEKEEAQGIF